MYTVIYMRKCFILWVLLGFAQLCADSFDDIGLNLLRDELGEATPTGVGVVATQVEAAGPSGWYFIDMTDPLFAGKQFTNQSGINTNAYAHTRFVAKQWYGSGGVSPGVRRIDIYSASDWYDRVMRRSASPLREAPLFERAQVQNHSWIAYRDAGTTIDDAIDLLRRIDYMVERDKVVVIASVNNGAENDLPDLLSHAYNVITVGTTGGNHTSGRTLYDLPGRIKPDIVTPEKFTSFGSPLVSGAASMIIETAEHNPELIDATSPSVIKAILLAGATKEEFPNWSREWHRPLDPIFGAGELNVYHNQHILLAGKANPTNALLQGWDLHELTGNGKQQRYRFTVPEHMYLNDLSVALTWQRRVYDAGGLGGFSPAVELADLDMRLYRVGEANALDESLSVNDNVEHIYQPFLDAGSYEIEISGDKNWQYGLAWRSTPVTRPVITSVFRNSSGQFFARARVAAGSQYSIQASSNFEDWEMVASTAASGNEIVFPLDTSTEILSACRILLKQ